MSAQKRNVAGLRPNRDRGGKAGGRDAKANLDLALRISLHLDMRNAPFPRSETNRLILRRVNAADAVATAELMTPEVSCWLASWPFPLTEEVAGARILAARKWAVAGDAAPFAVVLKASGDLIGWVSIIRDRERPERGALGYWFGEKYMGNGYMREAAPIAIAAAFEFLKLDVIEAAAQQANSRSLAVMRGCGMKLVGQRMVHAPSRGRYELCDVYEIERPIAGI
jgi:ribosomal-protein-alanine N-acetyltransferase